MDEPPGNRQFMSLRRGPAPVDAQCTEQLRAAHDIAVLAALTSSDMYDHPLVVDIADLLIFRCASSARRAPVA